MPHRYTTAAGSHEAIPADIELGPDEVRDISAAAARLLRERAEVVLDSVAEGIYCLDEQGRTIFVNEAGARMFGYSPREMLGRSQHELVHHHYGDGSEFPIEECPIYFSVREGITQHVGGDVFWRKDGTAVPVDYTSIPLKEGRRVVGAVVTFRDVTAEQRAEKQQELLDRERLAREEAERARADLAASEERLRLAMSAGRMASWEWDVAGDTVHWSAEEEALYGLEPGTFEGTVEGYIGRIHPDDRASAAAAFRQAVEQRAETHTVVHRVVLPTGEVRWLESYGKFVYAEDGTPLRLVGVSIDVTQRMAAQAHAGQVLHLLESVFESSPSAISVLEGPDHVLTWANKVARERVGARLEFGKPVREIVPEAEATGLLEVIDQVYRTGESFSADDVTVRWDPTGTGEMREDHFTVHYQALRGPDGSITGVMSHSVSRG